MRTCFLVGICLLVFSVNNMYAQRPIKAQKKMIGTNIEKIAFSDFIANIPDDKDFDDKFKILEFWATWCKPCLEAVPHLNELKSQFSDQDDLVFLSVTYESPERTKKLLKKIKFETTVVSDQTKEIHKNLKIEYKGVMVLPRTVLVDDANNVVWYGTPDELHAELIANFLKGEKEL